MNADKQDDVNASMLDVHAHSPDENVENNNNTNTNNLLLDDHFRGEFTMEDSPSYEVLNQHKLLTKKYRVASEADLCLQAANSTRFQNFVTRLLYGPFSCCLLNNFEVANGCVRTGNDGHGNFILFGPGVHQIVDPFYQIDPQDTSKLLMQLLLLLQLQFQSLSSTSHTLIQSINKRLLSSCRCRFALFLAFPKSNTHHTNNNNTRTDYAFHNIIHGDRNIVTVTQGFIGYCTERGQPVLLPPGMHQ